MQKTQHLQKVNHQGLQGNILAHIFAKC